MSDETKPEPKTKAKPEPEPVADVDRKPTGTVGDDGYWRPN